MGIRLEAFAEYAQRDETRREHLGELQDFLGVRPFARSDYRPTAKVAFHEATGTDRGDAIVAGMIAFRAFDDFLLPPGVFALRREDHDLGLAHLSLTPP